MFLHLRGQRNYYVSWFPTNCPPSTAAAKSHSKIKRSEGHPARCGISVTSNSAHLSGFDYFIVEFVCNRPKCLWSGQKGGPYFSWRFWCNHLNFAKGAEIKTRCWPGTNRKAKKKKTPHEVFFRHARVCVCWPRQCLRYWPSPNTHSTSGSQLTVTVERKQYYCPAFSVRVNFFLLNRHERKAQPCILFLISRNRSKFFSHLHQLERLCSLGNQVCKCRKLSNIRMVSTRRTDSHQETLFLGECLRVEITWKWG